MRATVPLLSYPDVPFWAKVARELAAQSAVEVRFVASARAVVEHARSLGIDVAFLDPAGIRVEDPDAALAAQGIEDPEAFVFPEKAYARYLSLRALKRDAAALATLVERELDTHRPDVILQYLGGEGLRRILQRGADARGIPNVWLGWSPIPDSMGFYRNEMCRWENLRIPDPADLTGPQRARAQDHLDAFRARAQRASYPIVDGNLPSSTLRDRLRSRMHEMRVSGWGPLRAARVFATNRSIEAMEAARRAHLTRRVFPSRARSLELMDEGPFAFFPLQWWRESRTTVRAPIAVHLEDAALPVADALPPSFRLLVKDHPSYVGATSLRSTRAIGRHPRVRWLDPALNAHDVMRKASLVTVVNNTVGYEGILLGKRVLTMGREFYCGLGLTTDVERVDQLPKAIEAALASQPDEERILAFVHAVYEASYPGVWGMTDAANVRRTAGSILAYLAREVPTLSVTPAASASRAR